MFSGLTHKTNRWSSRGVEGQALGLFEDQVGGILGLANAPLVGVLQGSGDGAVALGQFVELGVQALDVQVVSQGVGGTAKSAMPSERIVAQLVLEAPRALS